MINAAAPLNFRFIFATVEDPRINRSKRHQLMDILFINVAATPTGADGPRDIADFTREKPDWCRRFVPLEHGVPSHDTIGRALSLIKYRSRNNCPMSPRPSWEWAG